MKFKENIIEEVEEFSTLPTIYTTLTEIMANPKSTINEVSDVISLDQSSAVKILKTANSSLYGLRKKIDTISEAISYIGFEEVKNLVATLSIIEIFSRPIGRAVFNPVDLWKHSIAVGIITRMVGQSMKNVNLENFFVAGVLHDLGKLLLIKYYPDDYNDVVVYSLENNITIRESEMKIFGITHHEVGGLLAEKWDLPDTIKNAIVYHHSGFVGGRIDQLVSSVHLANTVARMMDIGCTDKTRIPPPNNAIWPFIKLPDHFFTNNLSSFVVKYEESVNLLLTH